MSRRSLDVINGVNTCAQCKYWYIYKYLYHGKGFYELYSIWFDKITKQYCDNKFRPKLIFIIYKYKYAPFVFFSFLFKISNSFNEFTLGFIEFFWFKIIYIYIFFLIFTILWLNFSKLLIDNTIIELSVFVFYYNRCSLRETSFNDLSWLYFTKLQSHNPD